MASEETATEPDTTDINTLISSGIFMLFAGSLGSFIVLIEQVVMGRLLSPDAYGTVSIAIALLSLFTTLALVGVNQGIPRFMARFDNECDERGAWLSGG